MSVILMSPYDISLLIAKQMQAKRLSFNWSQKSLCEKSGVSFGVIKKFERTGKISLESLLLLALALDALNEFKHLFQAKAPDQYLSLDQLLEDKTRKRGRQ